MLKKIFFVFIFLNFVILSGCIGVPKNQQDACSIIKEKKSWRSILKKTQRKWGISPGMQLAFIKTESNFRPTARTQRKYFLGLIPSGRISSAYGYSQALDGTWKEYKKSTGNRYHRRSNFAHSTNFIGWYVDKTNRLLGISKSNIYLQYLAYHQGQAGFKTGAYKSKKSLLRVAKKTAYNAKEFNKQLKKCM